MGESNSTVNFFFTIILVITAFKLSIGLIVFLGVHVCMCKCVQMHDYAHVYEFLSLLVLPFSDCLCFCLTDRSIIYLSS